MADVSIFSTSLLSSSQSYTPERELLIATLDRAVLDFHGNNQEDLKDAQDWLFNELDSGDIFSFNWICEHLGVNPGAVRIRILNLDIPRTVSQAHRWLRNKVQSEDKGRYNELKKAA